jgi:hypothetical protein
MRQRLKQSGYAQGPFAVIVCFGGTHWLLFIAILRYFKPFAALKSKKPQENIPTALNMKDDGVIC